MRKSMWDMRLYELDVKESSYEVPAYTMHAACE
jgi:hypothetical protein